MTAVRKTKENGREMIFNMPAEEYHSLERFSASGIKKILVSAQDFWCSSWMNKDKYEEKSDAFNLGTAYHTRILDGQGAFDERYAVKPDADRRTAAGKQAWEEWREKHPSADPVDLRTYNEICASKAISKFDGGHPEVTVLWDDEDTGIPMKSRIDYLLPGHIMDLKTFSNSNGMSLDRLLANHIVKYRYHVQAAVYRTAVPNCDFTFVFQQVGQVNNCIVKDFPSELLMADQGRNLMRQGIEKFAAMYKKYGVAPWYDEFDEAFTDYSFPVYALEE